MNIATLKSKVIQHTTPLGLVYLRGLEAESNDLDFYLKTESEDAIIQELLQLKFNLLEQNSNKLKLFQCVENEVLIIDIEKNFNHIFKYFPEAKIKQDFIEYYLIDIPGNTLAMNTIRYLFQFRNKKKYLDYFEQNWKEIEANNFFLHHLEHNPLKYTPKNISELKLFLSKKQLGKFLQKTDLKKYRSIRKGILINARKTGKTLAFTGPDGVGKSTVIANLRKIINSDYRYMGSNEYYFSFTKTSFKSKNPISNFLKHNLVYLENWIKYFQNLKSKWKGKVVLIDRYPAYQKFLAKGRHKLLHDLYYKLFFPKPDYTCVLYEDAEIIHSRKQELSVQKINQQVQANKVALGATKNVFFIKNEELNKTLTQILEHLK